MSSHSMVSLPWLDAHLERFGHVGDSKLSSQFRQWTSIGPANIKILDERCEEQEELHLSQ